MNCSDDITEDALDRLIDIAKSDTGQASRVANFLLAWWNAGDNGGFDLTDLWMLDPKITDDIITLIRFIAANNVYPEWRKTDFEMICRQWRPDQFAAYPRA